MRTFFASCTIAALLLAACLADHHHQSGGDMSCHMLSPHNADFGFALYKTLNAKADAGKNIFFSPLGISSALSLLSTGAAGETHSQIFATLGYGGHEQAKIDEAYKHLFHTLEHNQESHQLDIGNAVAVHTGFTPAASFMKAAKESYSSEVLKVDFGKPQEAAAEINTYIAGKTNNKIKDQVKDLDADMAMMLINYVYFRGHWERPFNSSLTGKADFHVDENTKVEVDMMKRMGRHDFHYDHENGTSVLMLPYKGNTSMMIILPDEGKMKTIEEHITKESIKHWHDSLHRQSVDVFLPKFAIATDAALDTALKEMGITAAFGDTADLSGISQDLKLKVSKASHQAVLSVDETGTEAAAVTTLEVIPMSMPIKMTMDRPFLVFILEDSTQSILFMGKINNPAAH
ncbi:alpha-1-antitrypsin homolog [Dunckerocampus dactyliophorus]|uniref:alpha-1-antitrypsin homolog n=1 Tax=Dunckerocampus dactyliophorus TaxID=161453 RepID=UPI00240568B9|nr:alpha-1-antitrypsin homolog [Dunckerocampus dactyliophorus]